MKTRRPTASLLAAVTLAVLTSSAHAACTQITTAAQLQAMQSNLAGDYCLANDIDLSSIANFAPVGTNATPFTGTFDGRNHVISNLKINAASGSSIGLFGHATGVTLGNVTIRDAKVTARTVTLFSIGILAGEVEGPSTVAHVKVSGKVSCASDCYAGGLIGWIAGVTTVSHSSSAADVVASNNTQLAGGLVGFVEDGTSMVTRSYATGNVTCQGDACYAGGLVAEDIGTVRFSFATGSVLSSGTDNNFAGGLIGYDFNTGSGPTHQSFALGRVSAVTGANGGAGGLAGESFTSHTDQTYAAGSVGSSGGAPAGGLVGSSLFSSAVVTNSYWDNQTSGQTTSAGGVGASTRYLTRKLPAGFGSDWSITPGRSFPFLTDPQIDFKAPLATLVHGDTLFTFLPIGQLDLANYIGKPAHAGLASLAAVYTMIARAVSISDDVASLSDVKINKYFWHDRTEKTTYAGPVTAYATLGTLATIPSTAPINRFNVLGQMNAGRPVILRGTYKTGKTTTATHYMLGTLYTTDAQNHPHQLIANDPYTGEQVRIDLVKKTVVAPARFPLAHFTVDGYQPVTLN